jgi:hypothetical protein
MYPAEQDLIDNEKLYDLILCSNLQQLSGLKTCLSENGVLIAFPPFGLTGELQYHGRLGIHFNTPQRLRYAREHRGAPVQRTTVIS